MDTIKDQLSFYASSLQLRGKRNNILASNIANAATPITKLEILALKMKSKNLIKTVQLEQHTKVTSFKTLVNQFMKRLIENH